MSTESPYKFPPNAIEGEPLTPEQKKYLAGFFAGIQERGWTFGDAEPLPDRSVAVETGGSDADNLTAEEGFKREKHPLDAFSDLLRLARLEGKPEKAEAFRLKWQGLFYLAPKADGLMCRLRIPGGRLYSWQLRALGRASRDCTTGHIQITTRANLQLRTLAMRDAPELLWRIQDCGLQSRGAGADNIRNLTANPTAGFHPAEITNILPLCVEMGQRIQHNRDFYDLPRKFNIAFDGGGVGVMEDTNDIGVRAVRLLQPRDGFAGDLAFRIALGGATGHQTFAHDLGVLVSGTELLDVLEAVIEVYRAHGDRTRRQKARLKHLLEKMSLEDYLAKVEARWGGTLLRSPPEEAGRVFEWPVAIRTPFPHLGVHAERDPGHSYVGLAIPAGRLTPDQLDGLADVAEQFGNGEVRLTVWQNLILPRVPEARLEDLRTALAALGLSWEAGPIRGGLVACTGNTHCKFAAGSTKEFGLELTDYLESRVTLDQPLNLHITGCPHSCAQHYIGDIGLLAATVKEDGVAKEGYHVFVGGGFGEGAALGRRLWQAMSAERVKERLVGLLRGYLENRIPGERFHDFTVRHELDALDTMADAPRGEPVLAQSG